jgi:non-ribosomal peptide synthetase component F
LQGEVLERLKAYWQKQLNGASAPLLPLDDFHEVRKSHQGGNVPFTLTEQLSRDLYQLSREEKTTIFMTLLAGLQVLLHHYTGEKDIVIGTDIANRTRAETETLIGFFVNLLALRTYVSDNVSFHSLLRQVREVVLDAFAHQDLPFETLIEMLRLDRSIHHTPLIRILFVFQNTPMPEMRTKTLSISPVEIDVEITRFDLAIFMWEGPHGLAGSVNYSTELFDQSAIIKMTQRFHHLLATIVARPNLLIGSLGFKAVEEKEERQAKETTYHEAQRSKLKLTRRIQVDIPG